MLWDHFLQDPIRDSFYMLELTGDSTFPLDLQMSSTQSQRVATGSTTGAKRATATSRKGAEGHSVTRRFVDRVRGGVLNGLADQAI